MLAKQRGHVLGEDVCLLGIDKDGVKYWFSGATWNGGWTWGGCNVETYTNNDFPECIGGIKSMQDFDALFFVRGRCNYYKFTEFFADTPFTEPEIWRLLDLMTWFYSAQRYSKLLYSGAANYEHDSVCDAINNKEEYNRINKLVIPAIMEQVYAIMSN